MKVSRRLESTCTMQEAEEMPPEKEETLDVSGWWQMLAGMCTRAGNLRKKLYKDIVMDLRRIEVMEEDGILSDIQDWWRRALSWAGVENPHSLPRL